MRMIRACSVVQAVKLLPVTASSRKGASLSPSYSRPLLKYSERQTEAEHVLEHLQPRLRPAEESRFLAPVWLSFTHCHHLSQPASGSSTASALALNSL